jgi:hypothetical protein
VSWSRPQRGRWRSGRCSTNRNGKWERETFSMDHFSPFILYPTFRHEHGFLTMGRRATSQIEIRTIGSFSPILKSGRLILSFLRSDRIIRFSNRACQSERKRKEI